jgi:DnaD/phage-associated family protein
MNDPAVLFYTSDFLTGVMDMTMEERGQYITLLCYQHQKGHIKEETIRLLVGSCSDNVLQHFKTDENGCYYNKRMDIEKEKRRNFTESRRENGKKGGRPKEKEKEPNGKPTKNLVVNHMVIHMGNENEDENININNNEINNNIYDFIQKNFGRTINPVECELIGTWQDNELTRYAIKQAIFNGKYNLKYINSILLNYEKNSITTVQQAQEEEERFKKKKSIKKNSNELLYEQMSEWVKKGDEQDNDKK